MDYYTKLKAEFPTFGATLQLDGRQQKSLDSLLGFTEGALSSYRSEVAKVDSQFSQFNNEIRAEKRSEALNTARAKAEGSIKTEFQKIENRVATAKSALYAATHQAKPKDSSEALLRFLQQKEIRDKLSTVPQGERVGFLQKTCRAARGDILWAVENQSIVSDLIPEDAMARSAETLGETMAPEQTAMVENATQDLAGATAVKNLAGVELGRIEA
jgi:hypothetical protein